MYTMDDDWLTKCMPTAALRARAEDARALRAQLAEAGANVVCLSRTEANSQ